MVSRSLYDEHDKDSNLLGIVTWSILGKKKDMRDRSIIWRCYEYVRLESLIVWKGINIPSLLEYLNMTPLNLFSSNESVAMM